MTSFERKQFLDIVQQFRLATEAGREQLAAQYTQLTQAQAREGRPITPVLGFCMKQVSPDKARDIFSYILARSNIAYWPEPAIPEPLRQQAELKAACYKHAIVPVKVTPHLVMLCGTNPHDIDGIRALFTLVARQDQYPIFVLSEPDQIEQALQQFHC